MHVLFFLWNFENKYHKKNVYFYKTLYINNTKNYKIKKQ